MSDLIEESWWLEWGSDSTRLLWARLRVLADGSAEVLDLDGKHHHFEGRDDAALWLAEDEYSRYEHLVADGDVPPTTRPPTAESERELVQKMLDPREKGA